MDQIECDFQSERSSLREKLVADLHEHRRRLIEAKERIDNGGVSSNSHLHNTAATEGEINPQFL